MAFEILGNKILPEMGCTSGEEVPMEPQQQVRDICYELHSLTCGESVAVGCQASVLRFKKL